VIAMVHHYSDKEYEPTTTADLEQALILLPENIRANLPGDSEKYKKISEFETKKEHVGAEYPYSEEEVEEMIELAQEIIEYAEGNVV
jgi:HEPN domain-containing protein